MVFYLRQSWWFRDFTYSPASVPLILLIYLLCWIHFTSFFYISLINFFWNIYIGDLIFIGQDWFPFEIHIYCVLLLIFPSNSLHIMISIVSNANYLSKFTYVMFLYQSSLSSWCSGTDPLWIHAHNAGFGSLWIHDFLALILFGFTYIMLVSVLFGFMTFYYWSSLNFLI